MRIGQIICSATLLGVNRIRPDIRCFLIRVLDPYRYIELDPDPELWPNLDPDPRVIMLYTYEYVINLEKMGDNL